MGIGDYDVGFFQQFYALGTSEIPVSFQRMNSDFLWAGNSVSILVSGIFQPDGVSTSALAEKVHVLILVAGSDEFLESEIFEIIGEVVEEIADARVVAVAEHGLAPEMLFITLQFILDVGQLGVEFIFLFFLRLVKAVVSGHDD